MIIPEFATWIMLAVSIILLIILPILDGSERFGKYISLRYILVSVSLVMALGCVLDFSHLAESSRNIVLVGGFALVGVYIIVRTLEKNKLGSKLFKGKSINLEAKKGDIALSAEIKSEDK